MKTAVPLRKESSDTNVSTPAVIAKPDTKAIKEAFHPYGRVLGEQSSKAGSPRISGFSSSNINRIVPRIDFWKRQEYFLTVGRVANVVQSYVLNIVSREWYYDDTSEGAYEQQVKQMEEWEETTEPTDMKENMIRNWIINGVHIISPKDWVPLQLQPITGKIRDEEGNTIAFLQLSPRGVEVRIDAKEFLEIPYINLDREPWGTGLFDSLMNSDYVDVDGRPVFSLLDLYRQSQQDNMRIHHKYASPRVIYTAEGVQKEVADNDIIPVVEGMKAGDRAFFNANVEIKQETVDGNGRFIEYVNKIKDEVDAGLQSSSNRIITEPSAMADAREAGFQDDDRVLGLMEKIRQFYNHEVIPRVTGLKPGLVVFKWGAKDSFDLEFPEALQLAVDKSIVSPKQAQIMLEEQYRWKIPTDEEVIARFGQDALVEPEQPQLTGPDSQPKEDPNEEPERPKDQNESHMNPESMMFKEELEKETLEGMKADNRLKNEKILVTTEINRQLKELRKQDVN